MVESLLKGATLGLFLSISIGPVIFSILKQSISSGVKGGMAFIAGVSVSDISLVLISNVFTQLFIGITSHKEIIGIVGSLFLFAMGIFYLFFKRIKISDRNKLKSGAIKTSDFVKIFISGFFLNLLNPAVFLFWLTTSTSFIGHSTNEKLIIYSTCLVLVLLFDIFKVLLAGKIRNKLTPRNILLINRINGAILLIFGLILCWSSIAFLIKK